MNNHYIPDFQSVFKDELQSFIEWKRALGYKYAYSTCNLFKKMDNFFVLEHLNKKCIDNNLIENWLKQCKSLKIHTKQNHYSAIKMFTEYLVSRDYENIMIPDENPLRGENNFIPYIYTKNDINSLLKYFKNKTSLKQSRFEDYTLFCLIYCCGLRIGEAIYIKLKDFDVSRKTILLETTKNDVKRLIPLSESIYNVLIEHVNIFNIVHEDNYIFYKSSKGTRTSIAAKFRYHFKKALVCVGITRYDGNLPRVHDLRHTFAVNALKQMQEKGFDLYTALPILSIYLGHKSITETEHYLRLVGDNYMNIIETSKNYTKGLYGKKDDFYE